ncbi:MAG TPA: DUF6691 family protein [Polyangiaceae bacterium]
MKAWLTAWASGLVFGLGLVVSGMTDPRKIIGFLDLFGHWSPDLAFVMIGAIGVHAVALRIFSHRPDASSPARSIVPGARIDGALVGGAAVFGVGWGLAGYCPGPAIVSLGFGRIAPLAFVAASIVGIFLADAVLARRSRTPPAEDEAPDHAPARGLG